MSKLPADADFDRRAASQGGSSAQSKEHRCYAERKRSIDREREGRGPSRILKEELTFNSAWSRGKYGDQMSSAR